MATANQALSQNESKAMNGNEKENHMKGLFFDLVASLEGGDHPSLPHGYKQKPMTGFCKILDAFNETVKLSEVGSGIVCEVGSKDLVSRSSSDGGVSSGSQETSDSSIPSESKHNSSFSANSNSRYLTLTETDSTNNDDATRDSTADQIAEKGRMDESSQGSEEETTDADGETEAYHSSKTTTSTPTPVTKDAETNVNFPSELKPDVNNNVDNSLETDTKIDLNEQKTKQRIFNEKPTQAVSAPVLNPLCIEEVGPPLLMPRSSPFLHGVPQELHHEVEQEMHRYSDEIREIERILRENILPPQSYPHFGGNTTNVADCPSNHINSILIGGGMVQPFSDVLTTHSTCDAEANASPYHPESPYFLSTYQSCTSFASNQNQAHLNPYFQSNEGVRRTPSVYMDCVGLEELDSEVAPLANALDSINPTFVCAGAQGISEKRDPLVAEVTGSINTPDKRVDVLQSYMEQPGEPGDSESSCQEFKDFEDSEVSSDSPKSKSKARRKKRDYVEASSEGEHLWTSASASDFEDEN